MNHIDVAAAYGDAELRIAPWLREHRDDFFLATKTGERTAAAAREAAAGVAASGCGVDHVDLLQLHNLADPIEWDIALARAARWRPRSRAKDEGLVRVRSA